MPLHEEEEIQVDGKENVGGDVRDPQQRADQQREPEAQEGAAELDCGGTARSDCRPPRRAV